MGFFSDLWEGIKSTASNVYNAAKSVAGKVYDVVRKPVDIISGAGDIISKIPVIGSLAQPVIAGVKGVQSLLNQGKQIADVAKQIGLRTGGIVQPSRMFQKAE